VRAAVSPLELSPQQIEAMRQLATLGSADAARSLGRLLGTVVEAVQPRAQVARRGGVDKVLQPNGSAFSVHFTVEGGARLRWMMHVTQEGATLMGGLLLGSPLKGVMEDGTMYESALAEMSNIVVSSYVGGLAAAVGLTLVPSIPYVKPTMSETMVAAFGDLDSALFLVTDLRLPGVRYAGRIVAAPVDESLGRLLSMLGAD
jgi:chemotaxis protein CheY-P-specific phosphatase CheC